MFFIWLALMNILLGLTYIAGSIAMQYAAPIFFIGMRMAVSSVLLFGYLQLTKKDYCISHDDIFWFLLLGIVYIFIPYVGEGFALKYLSAAKVSLIWSLCPFVTAFFAWLFFEERMTAMKFVGMFIGIGSVIPVMLHESVGEKVLSSFLHISTADLVLVVIVVVSSFAWNLFRRLLHQGYQPLVLNAWAMVIGSFFAFIISPFFEVWQPVPVTHWSVVLMCLAFLVLIGGIICSNLYGYLLRHFTATFMSIAGGLIPFCTAFFQWLILGQSVSQAFVLSLCIILVGLFIFYKEELRQGYVR